MKKLVGAIDVKSVSLINSFKYGALRDSIMPIISLADKIKIKRDLSRLKTVVS